MGIARGLARLLLAETKKNPFSGSVLQLGRQSVYFTSAQLELWAKGHGVQLSPAVKTYGLLNDVQFFSRLGFTTVDSVDISDYDNPTRVLDLNQQVPDSLHARYDTVFDGGTLEHIFDQAMVLGNIHRLIKVGGRVIHASPCNNHRVDEGYFMYSPSLFYDFYAANHYRIEALYMVEHDRDPQKGMWKIYPYPYPGSWKRITKNQLKGCLSIFFVASKMVDSKETVTPYQGKAFRLKSASLKESLTALMEQRSGILQRLLIPRKSVRVKRFYKMPPCIVRY